MGFLSLKRGVILLIILFLLFAIALDAQVDSSHFGNAKIATWYKNKKAAASLTFDDNYYNQFAVALPYLDALGINATFFVVTSRIDKGFGGVTWDVIRKAAASGHEIASHTVSHPEPPLYPNFLIDLDSLQLDYEIRVSKQRIEEEVPTQKCLTFAYPGSRYIPRLGAAVKPLYIAARCGHWRIEEATPYNFWHIVSYGPYSNTLLKEMNRKCDEAISRGGWLVDRLHGVEGEGYEPISIDTLKRHFDYIKSKQDDLWIATFVDVVKYIREREAAFVVSISASDGDIILDLRDGLPDAIYDMKLTLIVNVPFNWKSAYYKQGDLFDLVETKKINGENIVCIDAIPDRGLIRISSNKEVIFSSIDKVQLNIEKSKGKVLLRWTGPLNNNIEGFEIQRTAALVPTPYDWETLAFISANIVQMSKNCYSYIDDKVKPGSYKYRLKAIFKDGNHSIIGEIQVDIEPPKGFVLYQNYPNPFNHSTIISFDLFMFERDVPVSLTVFNINGQKVATILETNTSSGHHEVIFNRSDLPSGEYFYCLRVNGISNTKKMMLLK